MGEVDIIVSECFGYFLLYEARIVAVLTARDRFLKPGGLMFPDTVIMKCAGYTDHTKTTKQAFWDDVYGINYSCVVPALAEEPSVELVQSESVATDSAELVALDFHTLTATQLDWAADFILTAADATAIHGVVAWFVDIVEGEPEDVCLPDGVEEVEYSTAPAAPATCWKQTIFNLKNPVRLGKGERVTGRIAVRRADPARRDIDVKLLLTFEARRQLRYYRFH